MRTNHYLIALLIVIAFSKGISIRRIDDGASATNIGGSATTKLKFTTGLVFKFGAK